MKTVSMAFTAGQTIKIFALGNYFQLLETTAGVDIDFMIDGAVQSSASNMEFGFYSKPAAGFTELNLTSATAQTIKFAWGIGEGGYNRTVGSVSIVSQQSAFTQAQKTVTNVSAQLLAARPGRLFFYVENNDATGDIFVTLDGSAATVLNGKKIPPGGNLLLDVRLPSAAIFAIGNIASNANIVVMDA